MKSLTGLILCLSMVSCTTMHFRSNNTIPVSFDGNPAQKNLVFIEGDRNFYFWGVEPEHESVYVDEEVRKAGYNSISKVIIYEHKHPWDIAIKFLTFGIYMPTGFTITGFTSDSDTPEKHDLQQIIIKFLVRMTEFHGWINRPRTACLFYSRDLSIFAKSSSL